MRDLLSLTGSRRKERVRPTERSTRGPSGACGVAGRCARVAEQSAVRVEITGEPGPVIVAGDPDRAEPGVPELIENAIKYGGRDRRVTVAVSREARDLSLRGPAVRIDVIDEGEGIDPIHLRA